MEKSETRVVYPRGSCIQKSKFNENGEPENLGKTDKVWTLLEGLPVLIQ